MVEYASSTYTYILGCGSTRKAVIIDPVMETAHRDAQVGIIRHHVEYFPAEGTKSPVLQK